MPKRSAGIIAYRFPGSQLQVLLVHPGGPFFAKKDEGVWSIPKGEYEENEDPLTVAKRELEEETGNCITADNYIQLTPVKIKSGKIISCWAVETDFEKCFIRSNYFEMEWPPKSGKKQSFPETDKAQWFSLEEARKKINAGQLPIIEELESIIHHS
ncbi:MAG: hydrolase [Chitinophagaceae bacterium]|nr:hydrolase [Chitinophagaceae bacterium]